ncbi:MaoC/PaaZ C-terminal domain-containing protein [Zavarzinia compransoris]|nr:MaoC/PaaZ C-terminal domain-containing protein [Zavarzinia compransoris]TDP43961.1 acyl dehydratase [Zavarzinia compransoris]
MGFSAETLLGWVFPFQRQSYVPRDAILYALGLGLGRDPLDAADLGFLLEDRLKVLPTFGVTLATLGMWVKEPALGIDWVRLVHSAQAATFHAPLPAAADVTAEARIVSVQDRGEGKGAVVVLQRVIRDARTGAPYCTLRQTLLLRGNGGFGGPPATRDETPPVPARAPDVTIDVQTSPRAALIYRLSGDWNPLHADPAVAARAGFERPILHGLASYGIAGRAVLSAFCRDDPAGLRHLAMRFSGIVIPGDTLNFRLWRQGQDIHFNARIGDRLVLDQGFAQLNQEETKS